MNYKINTICFIFLLLFLICSVSASDCENETILNINQPDPNQDLCKISIENSNEKLQTSNLNVEKLQTTSKTKVQKEKVILKAQNVKMHYKDGSKFTVTVKDKNKKALSKAKVKITINGKTYSKTTDKKGKTSIDLNLNSGTYSVLTNFLETSKYSPQSIKSTITIKSTIKCSNLTKYYKNTAKYYSTFYDKKGKLLKNTSVKFKLNNKSHSVKTNKKGVANLAIDLKPGKYYISSINSKTSETISKTILIKSLIETKDLKLNETDRSTFNVKILNSKGKISPNKKVLLKLNGKNYTKKTNKSGIASLEINLDAGTYKIVTEYGGLKSTNKITVNKANKITSFSHITQIPNYVNLTHHYVFPGSGYIIKSGPDGIIKLPKNELITINIKNKEYLFSKTTLPGIKTTVIGYKSYLIPFDGGKIQNNAKKENLKGNGIIISEKANYTEIEYRSITKNNTELFGFYADKGSGHSETFTYMENDIIKAKINFKTISYDELGLKYSLSKFYGRTIYDFNSKNYTELTYNNTNLIRFANTNTPVTLSNNENSIAGYPSKEIITTKFLINGSEINEKQETISYGLSENYRKNFGFEVLQTYSIINEKITKKEMETWITANSKYINQFGAMNIYAMHLASIETTWLADAFADKYTKELNVSWKRDKTAAILGGINLDDTYLNILTSDMGMNVKGNENNVILFKLMNSLCLPNLEDYSLSKVSERYMANTSNSLDNMFNCISKNNFSIVQLGEMIYIFSQDEKKSAIILNSTSGIADVILSQNSTYKGSSISTSKDCCSVTILPRDIIAGIKNTMKLFTPDLNGLNDIINKIHPASVLIQKFIPLILGKTLSGASAACAGLFSTMVSIQTIGTYYRDNMVSKKEWYNIMDSVTFTRPGYLQGKKIYNIPNKNGGCDYIEVKINDDLTLDRNNAIYISDGKTKKLTKAETYRYFSDEYWSPINMPPKYWDKSWKVNK